MSRKPLTGMGNNTNGMDMPTGLGMHLVQDQQAMDCFGAMSDAQKHRVIQYVREAPTGDETRSRIYNAVQRLHDHQTDAF